MTTSFDDGLDDPPEGQSPRVFTRVITVPAAFPWEQDRAANLDSRVNAPVASPDIVHQVRRLEVWRPGRPARFLAAYVRAGEVGEGLTTQCQTDRGPVTVVFVSSARRQARVRRVVGYASVVVAVAVALVGGIIGAVAGRLSGEAALTQAESVAEHLDRQASQQKVLAAQDLALLGVEGENRRLEAVGRDLAWASTSHGEGAQIEAFHWQPNYFAVEVRGEIPPFGSTPHREITRAARPVRTGVWLWGVAPERSTGAGVTLK